MLTSKDVHPLPQIEEVCECVYVYVCMCVYVCVHVCVTSVRGYEAMEQKSKSSWICHIQQAGAAKWVYFRTDT